MSEKNININTPLLQSESGLLISPDVAQEKAKQ